MSKSTNPQPLPIPKLQQTRYGNLVAEIIKTTSNFYIGENGIKFIGQNGMVSLPSREELLKVTRTNAPLYTHLTISVIPINLP